MSFLGVQEKTPACCVDRKRLPRGAGLRAGTSKQRKIQINREDGDGVSGGGSGGGEVVVSSFAHGVYSLWELKGIRLRSGMGVTSSWSLGICMVRLSLNSLTHGLDSLSACFLCFPGKLGEANETSTWCAIALCKTSHIWNSKNNQQYS